MKNEKQQIEKLKEFWTNRNPSHENNANTGEDMFWGTVLCIFEDMNRANGADKSDEPALPIQNVNESLLQKYIEHVGQCEGITFVNKCNDGCSSNVVFSDDEIRILEKLS